MSITDNSESHRCKVCDRIFKTPHALKVHMARNPSCRNKSRMQAAGEVPQFNGTVGDLPLEVFDVLSSTRKPQVEIAKSAILYMTSEEILDLSRKVSLKVVHD